MAVGLAQRLRISCVLLLVTVPLWVWPELVVPYVTTKVLFVRALVAVALASWCVLAGAKPVTRSVSTRLRHLHRVT